MSPIFDSSRPLALDLVDKEGRRVVWYKDSYLLHVGKRIDIKRHKNFILQAIEKPRVITKVGKSEEHRYSELLRYDVNGDPLYMKVCIKYDHHTKFGSIQTAFLCHQDS